MDILYRDHLSFKHIKNIYTVYDNIFYKALTLFVII